MEKLIVKLLWFIVHLIVSDKSGYGSIRYDELEKEVNEFMEKS